MKKIITILLFTLFSLLITTVLNAQNLVPNPSFEIISSCPTNQGQLNKAVPWFSPTYYTGLDMSDLLNECSPTFPISDVSIPNNGWGYQYPRTGKGYAGVESFNLMDGAREYISVKLDSALIAGKTYCVGFYASLENKDTFTVYSIDRMGAYLSSTAINLNTYHYIPVIPQIENPKGHFLSDTLNWMLVSGTYIAQGGEQYITIGNFYPTDSVNYIPTNITNTASYYYLDDVSVYDCNAPAYAANAGNNITICKGDSVQIGAAPRAQYIYNWLPAAALNNDSISNPWVKPAVTTTYYLHQKDFKFDETIDSVIVTVRTCEDTTKNSLTIPNAFTPNGDGYNDYFKVKGSNIRSLTGKIFNRWGEELFRFTDANSKWDGKYKGKTVSDGVYFYIITATFNNGEVQEKHGCVEVVR